MRSWLRSSMLAVVLGAATGAWACRGPFAPLEANVARAALVVVGEFVAARELVPDEHLPRSKSVERIFKVEATLKGQGSGTVAVRADTTTCGFGRGLTPGQRVLLFAAGTPLATSATSGNVGLRGGAEEQELLAKVRRLVAAK